MSQPIIITGQISLSVLLITFVTIIINHLLANTRTQKNKRSDLASNVSKEFIQDVDCLIHNSGDTVLILNDNAFRRHESAIRNLLPNLSWFDRFRLKRAWYNLAYYKNPDKNEKPIPFYIQYADCGSTDKREKMRKLAIDRIQNIISLLNKIT